ncbi:MAG TPA: PilN domain-containing protein [Candidatus Saccharimonadales bacterium]|nr:PilN domain-containing protein [Candidatus Saccharimonadales bacterium]
MAEKTTSINLLPQNSDGLMTQFFNWALSIGRLLIILVEILALSTFIYRFSLDMQLVNLHDKIKSESFILDNFQSAETTFVDLQTRLSTIQQYSELGTRTANVFNDITTLGKNKVTFKDLVVNTQSVTIEAQAPSASSLTEFVNKLKQDPLITSVSVDKVETSPSNAQITVVLIAKLKQAAFAQTEEQTTSNINQAILNTQ